MRYTAVIFAAVFIKCCLSLDSNDFVECKPNTICSQNRGLIKFDWWKLNLFERQIFNGQSWVIKPDGEAGSSVTIAFKNLNILGDIFIAIQSGNDIMWRKLSWDLGSNFEYTHPDVTSFTIYVPNDERGSFEAFFYIGCEVLTRSFGEVTFPSVGDFNFNDGKCWIVEPRGIRDLSRLYFTFRDVHLRQGLRLSVTDIHTNRPVASITGSAQYDIYESNMRGEETFMIELTCGERNERCSTFGNIFDMSYYSLSKREVACVEIKRQCALGPYKLPTAMCQQSCPKLDEILQEELQKEGPVYSPQAPIVKSGLPMRARLIRHLSKKVNDTQEQRRLQKEKEEKEKRAREEKERLEKEKREQEEAEREATHNSTVAPTPKPWNCQLPKQYCKCMKSMTDITRYCFSKKKCSIYKACREPCVFVRLAMCARRESIYSIKLL